MGANTPNVTEAQGDTALQAMGFMAGTGSGSVSGAATTSGTVSASDAIQINGIDLGAVTGTTAADKAFAINAISTETGVSASATTEISYEAQISTLNSAATNLTINGVNITVSTATSLDDVVTAINAAGIQGVVASADNATGSLTLTAQAGLDIKVNTSVANSLQGQGANASTTTHGEITLEGADGKDVIVTSNANSEANKDAGLAKLGLRDVGGSTAAIGVGLSVNSVANANNTIDRIDDALDKISDGRANLGAIQNRLSSTISNLSNVSQNISAANSRIRDADFAAETSALSKSQVLQQAGTAMLSQANASTQSVLSLLG